MKPLILALVCGFGQHLNLDPYGNETCVYNDTGEAQRISGGLSHCPTGSMPLLTDQGPACVQKDSGVRYFSVPPCPNGTAPRLDRFGNWVCG